MGPTSTTIFKDYASVYSSQPQSINPTLILDPSYETAPISQEYAYTSTIQPTMQIKHNARYAVPRGISPSSSDSSIRSVDSWPSHNVSSRSSPASSISSRHLSPMPELHLPPPKHSNKSSHLRVQTGSASIRPNIVSPRHAKRVTPYQDLSEGGDGKKKYSCPNCGKNFTRDSDRKRHCEESTSCPKKMNTNDEINFACEYCLKHFSRLDSLERHRKNPTACTGRQRARR